MSYSNSISKVKQDGEERTTKTVLLARLGVSEEANAVSLMKWDWNYIPDIKILVGYGSWRMPRSAQQQPNETGEGVE